MVRIAVPAETLPSERRVALVPDAVAKLVAGGAEVAVQAGAGRGALFDDGAYRAAGAVVLTDLDTLLREADVVVKVQPPTADEVAKLAGGAATVSFLAPASDPALIRQLANRQVSSFSLDLLPRISRAQSMDALSSQALVSGYRAALIAAARLPRFFPLNMTAAGTVPPARVLVLGAGVAGLQAIATARRLGAVVHGYDVRPASADEVRSLGATFVELDLPALEGTGGYAREMSEERSRRQQELLAPHVAAADVLITTAAVPNRAAPQLVTTEMVAAMKPGSVVVDLAAESGGNVEASRPGEEVAVGEVTVIGVRNLPSSMAGPASALYSKNISNLLALLVRDGRLDPDFDDEVVVGCCVTHAGEVRHGPTRDLVEGGAP